MTTPTQRPMRYLPTPEHAARLTTAELRAAFLVDALFQPGRVVLRHVDLDRVVLGGVVPTTQPLALEAPESLRSEYFAERREIGILNVGGRGAVTVDGARHDLDNRDMLYVGRGSREIVLSSAEPATPAAYYMVSYPAHVACPTRRIAKGEAQAAELGTPENANRRILRRYIHPDGAASAQLVMGITELQPGSVWNSMPPHVHHRRTEVYLYFDVPSDGTIVHLMGEPHETRHLMMHDREAVLAPGWSVHAGCGTSSYTFCWAMGGENQEFADMQPAPVNALL